MADKISQKLVDFIIEKEVTSQEYYTKNYERPEWPGVNSGITVGIGYDLGYNKPEDIQKDWAGVIPDSTIKEMCRYSGLVREAAQRKLAQSQNIRIPWEAAYRVFTERTIPKWLDKLKKKIPNLEILNEDQLGVLLSLAYNRGINAFDRPEPKYKEMRAIKAHMEAKEPHKIPAEIRAMVRIWPTVKGLQKRRLQEADLFEAKREQN